MSGIWKALTASAHHSALGQHVRPAAPSLAVSTWPQAAAVPGSSQPISNLAMHLLAGRWARSCRHDVLLSMLRFWKTTLFVAPRVPLYERLLSASCKANAVGWILSFGASWSPSCSAAGTRVP